MKFILRVEKLPQSSNYRVPRYEKPAKDLFQTPRYWYLCGKIFEIFLGSLLPEFILHYPVYSRYFVELL